MNTPAPTKRGGLQNHLEAGEKTEEIIHRRP